MTVEQRITELEERFGNIVDRLDRAIAKLHSRQQSSDQQVRRQIEDVRHDLQRDIDSARSELSMHSHS